MNKTNRFSNKGLQHALIIDSNDSSINYSHTEISNNTDLFNKTADMLIYYLLETEILNKWQSYKDKAFEIYQTLYMFKDTGIKYKVKSFKVFSKLVIFGTHFDKNGIATDYSYNYSPYLDWLDLSDLAVAIMPDGSEVSVHKCNGQNAKYIKLISDDIPGDDIVLKAVDDWLGCFSWFKKGFKYQNFDDLDCINAEAEALNDFDGWKNTYLNKNINKDNISNFPAFDAVWNISDKCGVYTYQAYIPAMGQLEFLSYYQWEINYIAKLVNKTGKFDLDLTNEDNVLWMSSTECGQNGYYARSEFYGSTSDDTPYPEAGIFEECKMYEANIYPLYKQI